MGDTTEENNKDSPQKFDTVLFSRQHTLNGPEMGEEINIEVPEGGEAPNDEKPGVETSVGGHIPTSEEADVNSPKRGNDYSSFSQSSSDDPHTNKASSLVTQTDKDGNPIKQAEKESTSSPPPATTAKLGWFRRFFSCCFRGAEEGQAQAWKNKGGIQDGPLEFRNIPDRNRPPLLGAPCAADSGKKCLVLDLDETLVHSSFKPTENPDYIIPVEIDNFIYHVYVGKRPGVDIFLEEMGKRYEIVVYTASLSKYADPLLDKLDKGKVIRHRLFRESCVCHDGNYVKDLSLLNRDLKDTIIIDNSPTSYIFHPSNAIGCGTFIDDPADREMYTLLDFLSEITDCSDVRDHCHRWTYDYCSGTNPLNPRQ